MRIKLQKDDGATIVLDIIFWKTDFVSRRKVNGKELIDTYCQVSLPDKPGIFIAETKATQNPTDKYNRIVGKKVALAKAIADIDFLQPILSSTFEHSQENKEMSAEQLEREQLEREKLEREHSEENRRKNTIRRLSRQHIWNVFHQTFKRWD